MKRSTTSKTSKGTSDDGLIRNIEFPSVNSGLVPEESVVICSLSLLVELCFAILTVAGD